MSLILENDSKSIIRWAAVGAIIGLILMIIGLITSFNNPDINWIIVFTITPLSSALAGSYQLAACLARSITARATGYYLYYWIWSTPGRYASDSFLKEKGLIPLGGKEKWKTVGFFKGLLLIAFDIVLFLLIWMTPWVILSMIVISLD